MNCSRLRRAARAVLAVVFVTGALPVLDAAASNDPRVESEARLADTASPAKDVQTYTNPLIGFSITAPSEWRISETGRRIPVIQLNPPGYDDLVAIQVSVHRRAGPNTPREWMNWTLSNYGRRFVDIHEEAPVSLGAATSGFRMVFEWNGEVGIKEQWTGVLRGRRSFVIRAFGTTPEFDRRRGDLEEIITTFTLLNPDPTRAASDDVLVLLSEEPDTLDPALHTGPVTGMLNALFGGVVRLDENMNVVPDIAEDWHVSGDGRIYTFKIRFNAFSHDGDWVTAPDVKYSWERAAAPETGSPTARVYLGDIAGVHEKLAGEADEISGVEALDLFTLRVTLASPRQSFLQKLTHPVASVVNRQNAEAGDLAQRPVGTGPYKFVAWGREQGLILERNRIYHLERSKLLGVVYRFDRDDPLSLYSSKQIDALAVPMTHIEQTRDPRNPLYPDLISVPTFCTHYLAFDTRVPPFDHVAVRRAFAQALDVDKLASVVMRETVKRATTLVPPGIPGHDADLPPIPFDLDAARSSLVESSDRADAASPIPSAVRNPTMVWMWREYLDLDVREFTGPSTDHAGVWTDTWCPDYLHAENYLETLLHSDGLYNRFGYSNPQIDGLLRDAAVNPDADARSETYKRIEQIARDDWLVVPLWHEHRYELVQQHVVGYRPPGTGVPSFEGIYFER